ncbi:MAG: FAD-dependent oxidoreductase, partial [Alphaproteobacteria bacterium]|nr:FAD-dependent oxidoreductase [Alphaproteobacteria bacterium]
MTVAIIGAGLAGLTCARVLMETGHAVRLFDKGRAPGGRLATKRLDARGTTLRIDHGAQYLRPRDTGFAALLAAYGAAPWPDEDRFVPTPSMSALPRAMAEGLDIALGHTVANLRRDGAGWRVDGEGPFETIVLTAPAPQSAALLAPVAPELAAMLSRVVYAPCWTWLAAFDAPLPLPDALRPDAGPIGWAARNNSKPGRDAMEAWVVQATPEWSRANLEATPDIIAAALRKALDAPAPIAEATHRWRYSLVETALERDCIWDAGR